MIFGIFTKKQFLKLSFLMSLEFFPIIIFAFIYKITNNIFVSTGFIMGSTLVSLFISYFTEKRFPKFAIFISILVLFFGYLTIHFHDRFFIQFKDTIQDFIIASIFLISYLLKYNMMKKVFGYMLPLSEKTFNIVTINWIFHFYFLVILNEIFRRNLNTNYWVYYKVFAILFTLGHGMIMLYINRKEIRDGYKNKNGNF